MASVIFIVGFLFGALCVSHASNELIHTHESRQYRGTVVFDIDGTIGQELEERDLENCPPGWYFPSSTIVYWKDVEANKSHPYFFDPFMPYVLGNLLENDIKIVFFSAGVRERNEPLIHTYFTQMLGEKVYRILKNAGQFSVFSKNDMVGQCLKNLENIGLSISDSILVDDNILCIAGGQESMIKLTDATVLLFFEELSQIKNTGDEVSFDLNFTLHHGPYILGVVHEALQRMENDALCFRDAVEKVFLPHVNYSLNGGCEAVHPTTFVPHDDMNDHSKEFLEDMINKGIVQIQKRAPGVTRIKSFPYTIVGNPWTEVMNIATKFPEEH